jgi:hypothetical protein
VRIIRLGGEDSIGGVTRVVRDEDDEDLDFNGSGHGEGDPAPEA